MYKVRQIHETLKNEKLLTISQTKQLSVNYITLDQSFWVKVGQTILKLFKGSKRVIVCSESSIVRSDVYFFLQDFTILLHCSVAALFQYACFDTFTAKFCFNGGDVIAAVCPTT